MSEGNGVPQPYAVSMSPLQRERLLQLHAKADAQNRGKQFLSALREIFQRLRQQPRSFGEALFKLTVLKLEIRTAAVHPLVVDYGVHLEKNLVLIQGFKLLD